MIGKKNVSANAFISSIAKFSISSWTSLFIGFLSVVITTRFFSPEVCGTLNLFNTASAVLVSIATLGLDTAFARFFFEPPKGWNIRELFTRCLLIAVGFLLILSCVSLFFFATDISYVLFQRASFFLTALLLSNTLSSMVLTNFLAQFYRYSNDSYRYTIQQVLMQFFSRLFVISAALIEPTVEMVLLFNTIGVVLLAIVYLWLQRKDVFSWSKCGHTENLKEVYLFALYSWPSGLAMQGAAFILPYMIATLLDAASLGIYASAGFFISAFNALQGGFRTYWAAFMYEHYQDAQDQICRIHSYVAICCIILLAGLLLFQNVLYLLIGAAFQGSRLFFALILIPPLLALWEQTTCYGIALAKKNQQSLFIYVITIVLNLIFCYFFIHWWGLIGAAVATVVSGTIRFVLLSWRGQIYYHSIRSVWETIAGVCLLLAMGVSNTVFYEQYWMELVAVLILLVLTAVVYRDPLDECTAFIKARMRR